MADVNCFVDFCKWNDGDGSCTLPIVEVDGGESEMAVCRDFEDGRTKDDRDD